MIRKFKFLLLMIIMSSIFMVSCEEEIILDTGDFESELVVNALFNHETPWSVHVTNSENILDNSTRISDITDAKVEIYGQDDNFLYELYHDENGVYSKDDVVPSSKRGYSIKVSAPGYHTVTAKSFVPEKSKLQILSSSIIENEKSDEVEVDFAIEDRSKLESYYIWEIVSINENEDGQVENDPLSKTWIDDLTNKSTNLVNDAREILEGGSFGNGTYNGSYNSSDSNKRIAGNITKDPKDLSGLSDVVIALGKIDSNINLPDEINHGGIYDEDTVGGEEGGKITVKYELRVMSISKELYEYYSSIEEYIKYSNNNSESIPYPIYTNVSNGLGIFAGFSESVIQF